MDNSMASRPLSPLRGDPYRAYEALPAEVRRALQEALVDWCPLRARAWHLDLLQKARLRPAQAAHVMVQAIRREDQAELAAFARRWAKGAAAYPHLAAGATLQRYAGPEGMPPAEPIVIPRAGPPPCAKAKAGGPPSRTKAEAAGPPSRTKAEAAGPPSRKKAKAAVKVTGKARAKAKRQAGRRRR